MAEQVDKAKKRTRIVKKNPFVLVMRFNDDEAGRYRILASEVFDKTVAAIKARDGVLKENGIVPEDVVKAHGGMRVAVCQFTDVVDFVPTLGFETKSVDAMDEIPEGAVQTPQAASDVDISEEDATPPAEAEVPAEAPVVPPEAPEVPEVPTEGPTSTESGSESGTPEPSTDILAPESGSGTPDSPPPSTTSSVDHEIPGGSEEFWDGISEEAIPEEPGEATADKATVPPAEPAEGDDDLLF